MDADFPAKLQGLFKPARYKVLYGGRGGAKSWGVARALLLLAARSKIRILCAREFQNSISDSVHRLLSTQIEALGLSKLYEIQQQTILGSNGSEFVFAGIRNNVDRIKSYEGIDIVWVEEAQTVSRHSWETLIPTIRKDSSEIWVTFNPQLETDETYQRFVLKPPAGAWVQKIDYKDNPWFPEVLQIERKALRDRDRDAYLNVWEGQCRQMLDGAVYAQQLREATENGHIKTVPYDPTKPVHTFWDLGFQDSTAIWFAQVVGFETRVLRYIEDSQKLQTFGYTYGTFWLPHDSRAKQLGTGKSIEELIRTAGFTVRVVPQIGLDNGINALRTIFPTIWFDREGCADGLQAVRHYRYEAKEGQLSSKPLHDWASHGADALRYLAVALKEDQTKPGKKPPVHHFHESHGWMG